MPRYALFKYTTINIGDEIQSLAARQYLPSVDEYVDRDTLSTLNLKSSVRLIANAWYTTRADLWPPANPRVEPLLIAIHLSDEWNSTLDALVTPAAIEYFKRYQPVGCRDTATRDILRKYGVDAYFSGCLTLTLRRPDVPRNDRIYFVDVPDEYIDALPEPIRRRSKRIHHVVVRKRLRRFNAYRFWRAENLLNAYASAHLVVTSRLHCAMPCRAMGTPVVFAPKRLDDPRFGGLLDFVNACSLDDLVSGRQAIDWDNPSPSPGDIRPLQAALRARCQQFVEHGHAAS